MLPQIVILAVVCGFSHSFQPISLSNLTYGRDYAYSVNQSVVYLLEFACSDPECLKYPPRVSISSENADSEEPLMVVARQVKELLSWQLPLVLESDSGDKNYTKTSRTLCHDVYQKGQKGALKGLDVYKWGPTVSVATSSAENTDFTIRVDTQSGFTIQPSIPYEFTISPSEPIYFFYNFTTTNNSQSPHSNYDTVILEVTSNNSVCMTVSIQNVSCPVFDTNADITYRGFYETVIDKGGITIPKYKFPYGFYVVFVAKPDDYDCTGKTSVGPSSPARDKQILLKIEPSITYNDYLTGVITTLSLIFAFYFVFGLGFVFCTRRGFVPREMVYVSEASTPAAVDTLTVHNDNFDTESIDVTEYDAISEGSADRNVRLGKSVIFLSDLARQDPRVHRHKSYLYLYNVLTVAVFYGLPAIQLVITYQRVLNQTGEQDLCYYNFLCAHPWPWGAISDFNHVFSNVGYIFLGILFSLIVYKREMSHKDLDFDRQYGIPQHYGMFYAMGVALIMEGVLSGSYHVCPSKSNFQFDSSFMYVMAVLCMVKLYQNRHPDINATAYSTFGVLAIAILLGMIGILEGNLGFWICFTILYLVMCFYLSLKVYYMGCCKFDLFMFKRVYQSFRVEFLSGPMNVLRPMYKTRMILLILVNVSNWSLGIWGVYTHHKDFALFLLAVFMSNTMLYFVFYIVMKLINGERVNRVALFFLVLSVVSAISAMYFFINKSISWALTPAQSRQYNQECKLFRFYDFHDIWHFLSAIGMFFTFMVLLTLDDDLSHKHRSLIVVF